MKKVIILMSTYNGEKYLEEQIESILNQKDIEIELFIRDDGSTDNTCEILRKYSKSYSNIKILLEENIGYEKSFLKLLKLSEKADYYAFSDQDDIWDEKKIISAMKMLEREKNSVYASSLEVVDENKNYISKKSFSNYIATIGSTISRVRLSGCTMLFPYIVKKQMENICDKIINSNDLKYSHDGWIVLNVLLNNGKVILDNNTYIKYRRHKNTVTNIKRGIFRRIKKELYFTFCNCKRQIISSFLIDNYNIEESNKEFRVLYDIKKYKNNFKSYKRLLFTNEISTGIKSIDFLNKIAVLLKRY